MDNDSERNLDILINIVKGDMMGSPQALAALEQIKAATAKGTEANEEHHKSFLHAESSARQFHRVLHLITEESPALGIALRAAIPGAGMAAAFTAVIVGLQKLNELFKEAGEEGKKSGEEATKEFVALAEAAANAADEARQSGEKLAEAFRKSQVEATSSETRLKDVNTELNNEVEAIGKVMEAEKSLALARAGDDEVAKEKIKARFEGGKLELGVLKDILEIRQKIAALEREKEEAPRLAAEAAIAERMAAGTPRASRDQLQRDLEARKKQLEDQMKGLAPGMFPTTLAPGTPEFLATVSGRAPVPSETRMPELQAQLRATIDGLKSIDVANRQWKTALDEMNAAVIENAKNIRKYSEEIGKDVQSAELRRASGAVGVTAAGIEGSLKQGIILGMSGTREELEQWADELSRFKAALKQARDDMESAIMSARTVMPAQRVPPGVGGQQ